MPGACRTCCAMACLWRWQAWPAWPVCGPGPARRWPRTSGRRCWPGRPSWARGSTPRNKPAATASSSPPASMKCSSAGVPPWRRCESGCCRSTRPSVSSALPPGARNWPLRPACVPSAWLLPRRPPAAPAPVRAGRVSACFRRLRRARYQKLRPKQRRRRLPSARRQPRSVQRRRVSARHRPHSARPRSPVDWLSARVQPSCQPPCRQPRQHRRCGLDVPGPPAALGRGRGLQRIGSTRASARLRLSPPPRARCRALLISISLASRGGRACRMAPISLGVK